MTDDPTGDRPPVIEELDNLHVGPAPIRAVLDAGHASQRRRRAVLASVAAVTVLLVGGGFASTQVLGDDNNTDDSRIADRNTTRPSLDEDLTVDVQTLYPRNPDTEDFVMGSAVWDPEQQVIHYLSHTFYSGSCPPDGRATRTAADVVSLNLIPPAQVGQPCWTDARIMIVTINGLTGPPTKLLVTEDGKERNVPVAGAEPSEPAQAQNLTVDVKSLSEDSVAPSLDGSALWNEKDRTLTYIPATIYDACLVDASATATDGSVSLQLTTTNREVVCADVAQRAVVTITGLTEAPAELTISENNETITVSVVERFVIPTDPSETTYSNRQLAAAERAILAADLTGGLLIERLPRASGLRVLTSDEGLLQADDPADSLGVSVHVVVQRSVITAD